jgi:hypothetical protein
MSYYWPAKTILTSAFSIILQVNKNSYSLLQKHVIVLSVNVTYTHQQELMLNIDNSYIVTTIEHTQIRGTIWSDLVCSQKLTISTKSYFCPWFHSLVVLSLLMKYRLSSKLLFSLPNNGHNISSCYSIFSFIFMFCRSLFVLSYFFFWPLCCLFLFDIPILITSLWYLHTHLIIS